MKVFLMWLVAACVVAGSADHLCAEYCLYLSSSNRNIQWQSGCDCVYRGDQNQADTSIYYEPVDYVSLPVYNHKHPFYLLNPSIQERQTHNNPVPIHTPLNLHTSEIDLNAENLQATNNRKQKHIKHNTQTNEQQSLTAPQYLDINIESEDVERSASSKSLKAEDLLLTEQRLLECTKIYALLHSRKNKGKDLSKMYLTEEYSNVSNEELTKIMRDKCSHISYIIEESLNEIKKSRVTSFKFRMDGADPTDVKGSHSDTIHRTTEKYDCTSNTEKHVQSNSKTGTKAHTQHQDPTSVTPSETTYFKTTTAKVNTIPDNIHTSKVSSKKTTTTSSNIHTTSKNVSTEGSKPSIESLSSKPVEAQIEATTLRPPATTLDASTSATEMAVDDTTERIIFKDQYIDQDNATTATDVEGRSENRARYNEGDVPLVKIITHEFSNDTVQSFINGTEDVINGDFDDEVKPVEVDPLTKMSVDFETNTLNDFNVTEPDISGSLYFLFNKLYIPAKFVQKSNGSLYIGIDGTTLCDTLNQNDRDSVLLKHLCKCYVTGNCAYNDSD